MKTKKHIMKKISTMVSAVAVMAGLLAGVLAPATYAACDVDAGITGSAGCSKGDWQPEELFAEDGVFKKVTNVLLFVIGAVSVVMLIIGGIRYTVSQGDQNAVTSAKNTILYAVIGLVVAILAYAAVNFVITSFAKDN